MTRLEPPSAIARPPGSSLDVDEMLSGSSRRMAHVRRYSGIPMNGTENVAEHQYFVSLYSLLMALDMNRNGDYDLDIGRLLTRAVLHDIDESMTGDFLRKVKYKTPGLKKELDMVAGNFVSEMESQLGISLYPSWRSAKDYSTIEGRILALADFMQVASLVCEQIALGNLDLRMLSAYEEVTDYLSGLIEGTTTYSEDGSQVRVKIDDDYLRYYAASTLRMLKEFGERVLS